MTIRFSVREHKTSAGFDPAFTFSKPSGSILRMNSTTSSIGDGYVFISASRAWLHGKYIRFYWSGTYTWSFGTIARIYDGEYTRSSNIDFPTGAQKLIKGAGLLQTLRTKSGTFAWETVDVQANVAGGTQEMCTIFFEFGDAWTGQSGYMNIDWFEINSAAGGAGNLYNEPFDDAVTMELSGTTGDYGYISSGDLPPFPASQNFKAGFGIHYDYLTVSGQEADYEGKNNAPAYLYRLKNFPGLFTIEGEVAIYTGTEDDGGAYFCCLSTELNPIQSILENGGKVAGLAILRQDPNYKIAMGIQEGSGDVDGDELNINQDVTYYFRFIRDALNHIRLDVYSDPDFSILVGSIIADDKPHPTAYTHWYAIDSGGYIGKSEPYSAGKAMIARLRSV